MDKLIALGILFAIIEICAFTEHIFRLSWNYTYFTTGIITYQKRTFLSHHTEIAPAVRYVQAMVKPNFSHGSIEFNEAKPNTFLFRKKEFEIRFYGNRFNSTHRVLYYDPATGTIEIKGYLNWLYFPIWATIVYLLVAFLITSFSYINLIFVVIASIILFFVSLYPAAIDSKINDEVIYHLKVYLRNQLTSAR